MKYLRKNSLGIFLVLMVVKSFFSYYLAANSIYDFAVSDIYVSRENFICLILENKSEYDFILTPELKEKVFLVIYINDLKRAEYKLKYLDEKFFLKKHVSHFKTNFILRDTLNIRVEINQAKEILEFDYSNNRLIKEFK